MFDYVDKIYTLTVENSTICSSQSRANLTPFLLDCSLKMVVCHERLMVELIVSCFCSNLEIS